MGDFKHSQRLRRSLWPAVAGMAVAWSIPVSAQETAEPADRQVEEELEEDASDSPEAQEEIVVTGSRVQTAGFTAPTPTTVLSSQDLQQTAPTQISEALSQMPQFRITSQPLTATTYANLRGIGADRTLTLVNGRRHVPTFSDGTVDLGVIPAILVSRTEVVTGGASASWGSDAVAGVVNLILKNQLEGIEGSVQAGISDYGDDFNWLASLAAGTSFAGGRGHFLIGGEYSRSKGVRPLQAPEMSRPWAMRGSVGNSAFATNGLPGTLYAEDVRRADTFEGGLITSGPLRGTTFLPNGETGQFGYGQVFANNMIGGTSNLGETPVPGGDLKNPFERWTLMGRAEYEITNSLKAFFEGTYAHVLSKALGQPARNNGTVSGSAAALNPTCSTTQLTSTLGNILVPVSNPFLPQSLKTRAAQLGVTCFNFGRVYRDPGLGSFVSDDGSPAIYRGVVGLEGGLFGSWHWEAYYQYGHNNFQQARVGNFNNAKYRNALDAVQVGSNIVCRINADTNTANDDAACAPLNVFGFGSPSQAAIDYITGTSTFEMDTTQEVAAVSARGDLFNTWAGPIAAATGAEYRKETVDAVADPISQNNGWHSSNRKGITGSYNVKEAFLELVIPLARDWPLLESFDLNLAARRTDYSSSGGVTTWKAGATWDVTDDLRFRATQSRDIRAGNLAELFTPTAVQSGNIRDPRTSAGFPVPITTIGNSALSPERADTFTAGVVYQPDWVPGLRLSADYYSIDIDGQIGTIPANEVLERCYLDNLPQYCALVTTGPTGAITGVTVQFDNLDKFKTSGVDLEASYRMPMDQLFSGADGNLSLRILGSYLHEQATTAVINATTTDVAGQYTSPHWTVFGLLSYDNDRFSTALDLRWYGGGTINNQRVEGEISANGFNINHVDPVLYANLSASYSLANDDGNGPEVYVRINNLFDKAPPFPSTGGGLFDPVGRSYRVGVRFKY
ncbi:TonB-dependent receptor plug domain-containing protein [Tsuneonella sp. HG222]